MMEAGGIRASVILSSSDIRHPTFLQLRFNFSVNFRLPTNTSRPHTPTLPHSHTSSHLLSSHKFRSPPSILFKSPSFLLNRIDGVR